jgi:hypothetical protein
MTKHEMRVIPHSLGRVWAVSHSCLVIFRHSCFVIRHSLPGLSIRNLKSEILRRHGRLERLYE